MTEQTRIDATIDEPPPERSVGLRAQFHRDWQEALRSGVEPKIDGYLTAVAEPEKSRLRAEFEKLAHEYRQKRAAANEQTQAEPGATRKSSEQSVTVNEAPDTKVEGNQRTAEY